MTINELLTLLNRNNNNKNYYIFTCGKKRKHIEMFFIAEEYLSSNIKLIAIPFLDYCYNKEPNKLIEMI